MTPDTPGFPDESDDAAATRVARAVTHRYLQPVSSLWTRLTGIVLLLIGATLTTLLAWMLYRIGIPIPPAPPSMTALLLLVALIGICAFCWHAGLRMALNRPNRAGTLFSPLGWCLVGIALSGCTALAGWGMFRSGDASLNEYRVVFGCGALALGCFGLAWRAHRKLRRQVPADAIGPRGWIS